MREILKLIDNLIIQFKIRNSQNYPQTMIIRYFYLIKSIFWIFFKQFYKLDVFNKLEKQIKTAENNIILIKHQI